MTYLISALIAGVISLGGLILNEIPKTSTTTEPTFGLAVLTVPQGGTGAASFTSGECLKGNGTGAFTTGTCGSGGGSDPFTHPAVGISATTTSILVNNATSTITNLTMVNSTSTNATSTTLAVTGATDFLGSKFTNLLTYLTSVCTTITGGAGLCDGVDATGAGGGSGTVSTSTNELAGQLAFWTSNSATPALLGQVATGTISAGSSAITVTAGRSAVGGALAIDCATASGSQVGCLASADWTTFNNKLASYDAFTHPAYGGSATTSLLTFGDGFISGNASSTIFKVNIGSATTTNATSTNLNISGQLDVDGLTSALILAGADGVFAEYAGTSCTNQFVRSLNGAGVATCATVSLTADVTGDLPFANLAQVAANSVLGNITSGTADAASIATSSLFAGTDGQILARSGGTWTGVATTTFSGGLTYAAGNTTCDTVSATVFGCLTSAFFSKFNSATTTFSGNLVYSAGNVTISDAYLLNNGDVGTGVFDFGGATSLEIPNGAPTLGAIGQIALDTTENELLYATSTNAGDPAVLKPYRTFAFSYASSTQGSGTTTRSLGPVDAAGYFTTVQCDSNSFLRVMMYDGTNRMHDLIASSTIGTVNLTGANNSFTAGEIARVDIGTTTASAGNVFLGCRAKFFYTRN